MKKENYSGHTPKLIKSNFLMRYVYRNFIGEYNRLNDPKNILLIPLGRAVEVVLCKLQDEGIISGNQILKGFPHPSGANVNRIKVFKENQSQMRDFVKDKFLK